MPKERKKDEKLKIVNVYEMIIISKLIISVLREILQSVRFFWMTKIRK